MKSSVPCGVYPLRVNVEGKGWATSNASAIIDIGLSITSFTPQQGAMGGGYLLTVIGRGFSPNTRIDVGTNPCSNTDYISTTSLVCTVPASASVNASQVQVSALDNTYSANASSLFTYNASSTPIIIDIQPPTIPVAGGIVVINGTGFGNDSVSVYVNDAPVSVLSFTDHYIQVNLTSLPPGRYPLTINTARGYARPLR